MFHDVSHTNASLMTANSIPITTTVADRLGHANVATTTKVYVHAIRSADVVAADVIQDLLAQPNLKRKKGKHPDFKCNKDQITL